MSVSENTLIDYFGNNEMCLGTVTKITGERLQIQGAVQKITKITERQILTVYGKAGSNPLSDLATIQVKIQEAMEEIDLALLWDVLLPRAGENLPLKEIAEAYFTDPAPYQISATARKLMEDKLHFQRQGQEFIVRSEEGVREMEELLRQRAERSALKERQREWLTGVLAGKDPVEVPAEMESLVQRASDFLFTGFSSDAVQLLSAVNSKYSVRENALRLLRLTNRLPEDADEFLLVNGIHAGFSSEVLARAAALLDLSEMPEELAKRLDLTQEEAFSIDDEWTREIDDALYFYTEGDRQFVRVHLAAPHCFVNKGDLLDDVAVERPLSLYLPTTTVTMFPADLGCKVASLEQGKIRPAMSLLLEFSLKGELLDWKIAATAVKVAHRLTYIEADEILNDPQHFLHTALTALKKLSEILDEERRVAGGVNLNRPELKLVVQKNDILVSEENQETPSHYLVREFMILSNHLAAKYALSNDIPVIYRAQDPPSEPVHTLENYDPNVFDQMVRRMKKTRLSTYAQPHAGLGLDLYTQISSPLRRYADLVIQRQISAHLEGRPIPYTQEELFAVLDNVERTTAQNRSLERQAKKYWLLEYIRRNFMKVPLEATVVRVEGSLILAELTRFYERGVVMTRDRLAVGDKIQVAIFEVNPDLGRMAMKIISA